MYPPDEDYYIENGLRVFTEAYLQKRGYCCESNCRHCPYKKMKKEKRNSLPKEEENLKSYAYSGQEKESFFEQVFTLVRQIPEGRVTSYGTIAKALGLASSARMVGWAMNAAHALENKVPAHRVVNRTGMLSGKMHFSPPEKMQALLQMEGIKVVDDQIVDFEKYFWNPMES